MCGGFNMWVCVCVGFFNVWVCVCVGFFNVWVCVCLSFVFCGCVFFLCILFDNITLRQRVICCN